MPLVPVYRSPQVQDTPLPGVKQSSVASGALFGAGAAQEQQAGAAVSALGDTMVTQQRIADQRANQLRVDDALNQAHEKMLDYTFNPDSGYLSLKGRAALERPDGQALPDEYTGKLQGDIDGIAGTLGNSEQQRLFKMQSNNLITQFRGQTMKWQADQQNDYGMSVRRGTIDNQVDLATRFYNDPARVDSALQSIDASSIDLARMQGKSAEEAIAFSRQQSSKAVMGAITGAMQNDDFGAATSYMRRYSDKMAPDDLLKATAVLSQQADAKLAQGVTTRVMGGAASAMQPQPLDRLSNLAGIGAPAGLVSAVAQTESGNHETNPDGSTVTSAAGAKGSMQVMDGTSKDPGYGVTPARDDSPAERARVGRDYLGAMLKNYNGNLTMALAAYNAGPGNVDTALAKAKQTGDTNWMQYLPKPQETIPYVRDVQNRFAAGEGAPPKPTLQDLQTQARGIVGDNNPRLLKLTMDNISQQYEVANKAVKQREDEAVSGAMRALEQNGGRWTDLPLDVRSNVPPDKVDTLLSYGARISKGDDITNPAVYQRLSSDPNYLSSLSDNQFYALRSQLSQSDWQTFSKQRGTATEASDKLNTAAINQVVNTRLATLGMDPTPKDDTSDAQRVGAIRKFLNDGILAQQQVTGKQMTDTDVEKFIDGQFAKTTVLDGFFSDSSGRRLTMKTGDIPSPVKTRIKNDFKTQGIANPTDADVLGAYWRALQAQDTNQTQRTQWFVNNTRNLANGN